MKNIFKHVVVAILTFEAKILLKRHKPMVIAVTGSVGKTSMKDAIYSILKKQYAARKSEKSFNSDIGVPLAVLGLPNAWNNPFLWTKNIIDGFLIAFFSREYPTHLVLETGVDRPGDMKKLTSWLKPNMVVLTRFPDVPAHVEFFATPEAVVAEKMVLVEALHPEGVVIFNNDDTVIQEQMAGVRQATIGYGRELTTHYKASSDQVIYHDDVPVGMSFMLDHIGQTAQVRVMGSIGLPLVYVYSGAIAVAVECGVPLNDAVDALSAHVPPAGRMRILKGIKGTIIIDDTYNASPVAVEQALQTLKEMKHAKRKIAVLGDMLELGRYSATAHEKVGEMAAGTVDALFTLGVRSRKIAETAQEHGLHDSVIFQHEDVAKAGKELQLFLQPGDVVLVKASQGVRAERVVEEVMAEPEYAADLLVRQDTAWSHR